MKLNDMTEDEKLVWMEQVIKKARMLVQQEADVETGNIIFLAAALLSHRNRLDNEARALATPALEQKLDTALGTLIEWQFAAQTLAQQCDDVARFLAIQDLMAKAKAKTNASS